MRVRGHELLNEGAAYQRGRLGFRFPERVQMNTVAGRGFAVCSCGARSKVLDSGVARKAWHRTHKNIVTGRRA